MKQSSRIAAALIAVSLLVVLAVPVHAGNSREVFIKEGTSLGGTEIEQGFYKLLYRKNGGPDEFVVSIRRNGKVIAEAEGTRVKRDETQAAGLGYRRDGNGGIEIAEIRIGGTRSVIVIEG